MINVWKDYKETPDCASQAPCAKYNNQDSGT
jgi:hypothetical protein